MSGVRTFMFWVLVPALIALAHDIYLFYANQGLDSVVADATQTFEDRGITGFFASFGFIWTEYSPESFKSVAESMDKETWSIINNLLTLKAFFVGLGFAGICYFVLGVLKILGTWPFSEAKSAQGFGKSSRAADQLRGRKNQKMQYKRK